MIGFASYQDVDELKLLWNECFSDTPEFIDKYFGYMFEPSNVIVIRKDEKIVAMATLHDVEYVNKGKSKPCGYLYAVGVKPQFRGLGYFKELMSFVKKEAKRRDYVGIITVPATKGLFSLYKKVGYKVFTKNTVFRMSDEFQRVRVRYPLTKCDREEFINMRQEYLNNYKSYIKLDKKQLGFVYDYVGKDNILTTEINNNKKYAVCEKINDLVVVKEHNFTQLDVLEFGSSIRAHYSVIDVNVVVDGISKHTEKIPYAMALSFGFRSLKGYAKLMFD